MKIEKNVVASLAYQVKVEDVVVDESTVDAPLDYLHGNNNLITGLETALEGKETGAKFSVTVSLTKRMVSTMKHLCNAFLLKFSKGLSKLKLGMRFSADTDQGPVNCRSKSTWMATKSL